MINYFMAYIRSTYERLLNAKTIIEKLSAIITLLGLILFCITPVLASYLVTKIVIQKSSPVVEIIALILVILITIVVVRVPQGVDKQTELDELEKEIQTNKESLEKIQADLDNRRLEKIFQEGKNFRLSISYPRLLSKRYESTFLVQIYLSEYRYQARMHIKQEFKQQEVIEAPTQVSLIKTGQRIKVKVFSPDFLFSDSVTKIIDKPLNKIVFLGIPSENCEPGLHKVLVSISDTETEQEFESLTIRVQVVDFVFDHVSRPLLSRVSTVVLGVGSFAMFVLTFLEQIDKTVGLTSGAAAGALALGIYASFYNLYQRVRPNTP